MIQTSLQKVKIHEVIQSQIPEVIDFENPRLSEFLSQYYISQEFQGGSIDIADNLVEYKSLDFLNTETLTGFTSVSEYVYLTSDTIFVDSTEGWPNQYGLLKIDNEIITYTGIGSTSFTGCVRGFSGIENNKRTNDPEYLTFTKSGISTHNVDARVVNLSNVFLNEFLKKLKKQVLPGFAERKLDEKLDQSNFIRQAKDFYKSKGTEEAFKILFACLYDEKVEMIQPSKFIISPSDADYIVNDVLLCELISGNPLNIVGQSLVQQTVPLETSGSIYNVEKSIIGGKIYYKIAISKGTTIGKFQQVGKTFITQSSPIGSTVLNVDSTVGFGATGSIEFEDRTLSYSSKSLTQFIGVSTLTSPCGIGSTVKSGIVALSYEDGDLSLPVSFNVLGVLNKFVGNAINQQEDSIINISQLGKIERELQYKTWIYNTASTYEVETFSLRNTNNYDFTLAAKEFSLYVGDQIEVIDMIDPSLALIGNITFVYDENSEFSISVNVPTLDLNKKYKIRRILKLQGDTTADVQNTYSQSGVPYVASNSLPHWPIDPQKRVRTFSNAGISTTQVEINLSDHNLHDGDLVVYSSSGIGTLTNLNEGEAYYIKKVDSNTVKLAYTGENVRRGQFLTAFVSNDLGTTTTHTLTPFSIFGNEIGGQKLLRKFDKPEFGSRQKTVQGGVGLFVNGVEAYSYKSSDIVYFGPLEGVEVLNRGKNFDIVNPPRLSVTQDGHSGAGASVIAQVEGELQEILVTSEGLDYEETPSIKILGGNNSTATAKAKMKFVHQTVEFDATSTGGVVNTATDRFVFATPHGFKDGEEVIYDANGSSTIGIGVTPGNLIDTAPYFVVKIDDFQIHLSESKVKATAGIGTINLTTNGGGLQRLKTTVRRQKVDKILVENKGFFKNRELHTISGINTFTDIINIPLHGFEDSEVIKYSSDTSVIGGLTNNKEYFVDKIDDNSFRLSDDKELSSFVSLNDNGLGTHIFQDPPISVDISGRQGISTDNAIATPIIRGNIFAVHVSEKGSDFGSTVINDNYKPFINIVVGEKAFLQPFIVDGGVDQIIIKDGGENFFSTPNIIISGDGTGCKVKANVSGGKIISIDVIDTGKGYNQLTTTARAVTPGEDAVFSSLLKSWTINQVERYALFGDVKDDDGFLETPKNKDLGNPYVNYYVPRNLRNFVGDIGQDHSPILGWAYDGNPIYGPFAVVDGNKKYIESSYRKLAGQRVDGPNISIYPAGFFIEDFTYVEGTGDLDEHNGRFAPTPEYPNGVYAYYTTVEPIQVNNANSPFDGARTPLFPYIIGDTYYSTLQKFNTEYESTQDLDPISLGFVRNTQAYNINEYDFVPNANKNTNIISKIAKTKNGFIDKIQIVTAGKNYNVGDKLVFDNKITDGFGAIGQVNYVEGPGISTITSNITQIDDIVLVANASGVTGIHTGPHNLSDNAFVEIIGISTDTHANLSGNFQINLKEVVTGLAMTMGTSTATGLTTSVLITDWIPDVVKDYKFKINDIVKIDSEQLKIVNFDVKNNRLELLRAQNGTAGAAHTFGSVVTRIENEFSYSLESKNKVSKPESLTTLENETYYFNAETSVGTGNTFGVGIGTTVTVAARGGNQITRFFNDTTKNIFIPTRTFYIPNHPFKTGDRVEYNPGAGSSIRYQTDAMKRVNTSFTAPMPPEVFLQVIDKNLVGVVTTRTGIGSDLQRVMLSANAGIGNTHFFRTKKDVVTGTLRIIEVNATSNNHTFERNDVIDLTVVSSATSSVTAVYDPGTRFVSIGSSVNPPISLTIGDTLEIDTSDVSLENTKLLFFLDQDYKKPFVGTGKSAIEVVNSGISGNSGSKTSIHFTNRVPDVLYYKFLPLQNTKIIEINEEIENYSKIFVNKSKFTGTHVILSKDTNTFTWNLSSIPERVGYSSASNLSYITNSTNVRGGVARVLLQGGGNDYKDIPQVSVASTTGSSANLKAFGRDIGRIDEVTMIETGYDYPSDLTLQPQAAVPQIINLKDNFSVESVAITSTGKNYLVPPDFVVYNSKTNAVNENAKFEAKIEGGSVANIKVIAPGGNLSSGDVELFAINNTNGVGIISATYNDPNVTLRLQTPLTGFNTAVPMPFKVGDKVFVENIGVSTGNGYNSSDFGYQSFTLTGVNTAFGNLNGATITYEVDKDPGLHDFAKFGTVSKDDDIAKFEVKLIESTFLNGEPVVSTTGNEARVIIGKGKTRNVLRVDSLVGFNTGDVLTGKFSKAGGTIESTIDYTGHFTLDTSTEKTFGWERDTGKLNDFYQRVQDNDYYQHFSYSLKSFVGINSWSEPVDSLAHIAGFKKHSDLLINSVPITAPQPVGISSGAGGVIIIDAEASLLDTPNFDLVSENTNLDENISDEVRFQSGRFGDAIICSTNRVLSIDDLSPQFYTDPNLIRSVELDTFDMLTGGPGGDGINAIKYYAQVVLDTSQGFTFNNTQYTEFVVFHDGTDAFINNYSELSDGEDLGEFITETSGPLASVSFVPNNTSFSYDVTFHKEILTNAVGVASTSFGFQEYKGKTLALNVFGSAVVQEVDAIDATLYKSGSILVAARGPLGEKEIDEFTWLADGSNNVVFTNFGKMDADTDIGQFQINMLSDVLKLRHISPVGMAVTVTAFSRSVGVAQTHGNTGITGSYVVGDTELDGTFTNIVANGSPSQQVISTKEYANYTTCRFHVEIHNTTDDEYSVFIVGANSFGGNASFNKYNNLFTADSEKRNMANTDIHITGTNTQLRFLPVANKAYTVRVAELKIDKPDSVASDQTYNL
tara:strand:+ start:13 stop:8304 length:8292 start_codon:yes stop_codon:yes gene_type:complete